MAGPQRFPVLNALGVVPHPVRIDDAPARPAGDPQHPPVNVLRHPRDHVRGGRAEPDRPVPPDQIVVGADPARGDQDHRSVQFELPYLGTGAASAPGRGAGLQDRPAYSVHAAAGGGQIVDAVPEPELDAAGRCRGPDPSFEGRHHAWPGAPGDVEAGHRVAVPVGQVAAALGPADHREPAHPQRVQPGPLLRRREIDVRLGPPVRPVVLAGGVIDPAVKAGAAEPVLPGQRVGVLDAQAPLLGRAHQKQAAEGQNA